MKSEVSGLNGVADEACRDPTWVKVAAADSSTAAKADADFVCAGADDQDTIQKAIDQCAKDGRDLYLYNGLYMLDAFRGRDDGGPRAAVFIPIMKRCFTVRGQSLFQAGRDTPSNGVVLYARSSIWATAGDGIPSVVLGGWTRAEIGSQFGGELALSFMPPSFAFDETPDTEVLARYANDGKPAVIRRGNAIAVGQAAGLTPLLFNRIVREAGA